MSSSRSLLQTLQTEQPQLRSQIYFKSALTALSHALEDVVLAGDDRPLVIANFQQERFYQQEIRRYERIGKLTDHTYILAAPENESGFAVNSGLYETIPLSPSDELTQEWHLVILSERYAACLICREYSSPLSALDQARRFEGFWGFDRQVTCRSAQYLLERIVEYRPELSASVGQVLERYGLDPSSIVLTSIDSDLRDASVFGQRLVTYLQASQYKLLKAYRALDERSQKEELINVVTRAIRRSLEPDEVLNTAVAELGQVFANCRCILYRCNTNDAEAMITYESVPLGMSSLVGQSWSIQDNPLIQVALSQERATVISNVSSATIVKRHEQLDAISEQFQIHAWLLIPIQYQGTVLGMVELHHCVPEKVQWQGEDIAIVETLATQVGIALSQADMFTQSEIFNQQLQALERTQTNLINIVGHELRTPLSTIQICLESLESEPDMAIEMRQIMLDTALGDAARMRKLVGDFLLLSRLEGQRMTLQAEPMFLDEAFALAMSGIKSSSGSLPDIRLQLPGDLSPINVDGESLVEVLTKLLDNACKFTSVDGHVTVSAEIQVSDCPSSEPAQLVVKVEDTGRGIEPGQLQTIFDSFYQEEDYLRRSVGGTGLGLSICRQMIKAMDGEIWAESDGQGTGSRFSFRLPLTETVLQPNASSSHCCTA